MSGYDHDKFDRNFKRLLDLCSKICRMYDSKGGNDSNDSHVKNSLIRYVRCYDRTEKVDVEDEHLDLFKSMYQSYRSDILDDGHKKTGWLLDNNIIIIYGSNVGAADRSTIKIYLSAIFGMASDLCAATRSRMMRNPDGDYSENEELNYPRGFLLYLYRIFNTWRHPNATKGDQQRITLIITDIEESLEINDDPQSGQGQGQGQGLEGVMKFAQGMLGKMGDLQKDGTLPDKAPDDIGATLKNIFSHPDVNSLINKTFKSMNESNDIGTAASSLFAGLSDPRLKNALSSSLKKTETGTEPELIEDAVDSKAEVDRDS